MRKRKTTGKYEFISDEKLSMVMEEEVKNSPQNFSKDLEVADLTDTKEFLENTSGRIIAPIEKWL